MQQGGQIPVTGALSLRSSASHQQTGRSSLSARVNAASKEACDERTLTAGAQLHPMSERSFRPSRRYFAAAASGGHAAFRVRFDLRQTLSFAERLVACAPQRW